MLPCLRVLELHGVGLRCDEPLQLLHMYEVLASLPHLETLTLPTCRALEGLGALGDIGRSSGGNFGQSTDSGRGLRRLEVHERHAKFLRALIPFPPSSTLAGLGRLGSLRELVLSGCNLHGGSDEDGSGPDSSICLRGLLASVPPAVQTLELIGCADSCGRDITACFSLEPELECDLALGGVRVRSVDFGPRSIDTGGSPAKAPPALWLSCLTELARSVLLPGLAPGRRLQRLSVRRLVVDAVAAWPEGELQGLQALCQRTAETDLGTLGFATTGPGQSEHWRGRELADITVAQLEAGWLALQSLGQPERLGVSAQICQRISQRKGVCDCWRHIQLGVGDGKTQLDSTGLAAPVPRAPGVTPAAMISTALGMLQALPPPPATAETDAAPSEGTCSATSTESWQTGHAAVWDAGDELWGGGPLLQLLLSGPLIATLVHTPGALRSWMGSVDDTHSHVPGQRSAIIMTYKALPAASTLLVACNKEASRALAASAEAAAMLLGMAGQEAGGTQLEVLQLAVGGTQAAQAAWSTRPLPFHDAFLTAAEQVMQAVCDEWRGGSGGVRLTREGLEWVLAVRDQLTETCLAVDNIAHYVLKYPRFV